MTLGPTSRDAKGLSDLGVQPNHHVDGLNLPRDCHVQPDLRPTGQPWVLNLTSKDALVNVLGERKHPKKAIRKLHFLMHSGVLSGSQKDWFFMSSLELAWFLVLSAILSNLIETK